MIRYLTLYGQLIKTNISRELMYRKTFIWSMGVRLGWFVVFLLFYQVLYGHIHQLEGFTYYEALLYFSVFHFFESVFALLFYKNIQLFVDDVRNGNYDFIATKPVSTLFMTSFRYIQLSAIFNVIPAIVLFFYALSNVASVSLQSLGLFTLLLIASGILFYSVVIGCITLGFWFFGYDVLNILFLNIFRMVMYPPTIYKGMLFILIYYVVPFGFLILTPVKTLLHGSIALTDLIGFVMLSLIVFTFMRLFFRFGLSKYASASS